MARGTATKVATIADVARVAGVSLATVSRVMNGRRTVDAELSARVRAAAAELGYAPSPLARGLVNGRTDTVAMVVPDLGNPVFQAVLHGLSAAAVRDDFRVLVGDSRETAADEPGLARDLRRRADAIVLCSPRMPAGPLAELVAELAPAVVVNRRDLPEEVPTVGGHFAAAAEMLLTHLTGLGHRRVLYLAGPSASDSNAARLQGIEEYRSRRDDLEVTVLPGGTSLSDGRAAAPAVVSSGVTAVVCFNDLVALGLLSALDEQGVDVPGEISVAGFDDVPFAAYSHPPLTSVALDFAGNGARAWQRLALTTPAGVTPVVPEPAEPRLVVRASTGPAA